MNIMYGAKTNEMVVIKWIRKEKILDQVKNLQGRAFAYSGTDYHRLGTGNISEIPLYDSLYIVGGRSDNQDKFDQSIMEFYYVAYKYYKPIGIATTGQKYIKPAPDNNFEGVIFATNNPNFDSEFIAAIAQQWFWNRI